VSQHPRRDAEKELMENSSFGPGEVKVLVQAFEDALRTLNVDRDDPVRLRQRALQSVSIPLTFAGVPSDVPHARHRPCDDLPNPVREGGIIDRRGFR
jgi:hypothetical protein